MNESSQALGIVAIVVTYFPEPENLKKQITALVNQVDHAVIVDNGSDDLSKEFLKELSKEYGKVTSVFLGENFGIAMAQNKGIHFAKKYGADFVLLMDQDSLPDSDMVQRLHKTYCHLIDLGKKVSAVGPRFRDSETGKLSRHVRFGWFGTKRIDCNKAQESVEVDFLISSGSLIPLRILDEVGLMDEGLFIDHVDTEWVLRAMSKGYHAYGDCMAIMKHCLGEHRVQFWFGRDRDIPVHKPFRYYYIFRNSIHLYKRKYVCWRWRWVDIIRLMQIVCFMSLVPNNRRKKVRMIFKGIKDGIHGKKGRLVE